VTVADNGATVRLRAGQHLRVILDVSGEQWRPPASSATVLRRTAAAGGYPAAGPAEATFLATRAGRATIHSVTDAACLHTQPRCLRPQRVWAVHITVTG
jgi:hypothetical protein